MKKINAHNIDERDRSFSPYRIPYDVGDNIAQIIVNNVLNQIRNYELFKGLRRRSRRKSAHNNLMAAITALVCDLMHRAVTSEKGAGRIHLSRRTTVKQKNRYQSAFEGRPTVEALDILTAPEMGFAELAERGDYYAGRQTAYKAGPSLLNLIDDHKIVPEDMTLSDDEEIVILKSAKPTQDDLKAAHENRARWLDYADTDRSNGYRDEMRRINAYLRHADIDYSGGKFVDLTNRRQRRYFNNASFTEGGRLFGGFWLNGLRAKQRKHISIDDCGVVEVDFRSMMPSLAYANQGLSLPARGPIEAVTGPDAYNIPGLDQWRTGVKRIFGALMFAQKPLARWPKGVREENFKGCDMRLPEIVSAIKTYHPALDSLWERGLGHHFHFMESEIIVDVLLECIERNITALQVHDGLVVSYRRETQAAQIMMDKFNAHTGQTTFVHSTAVRLLLNR